MADCGACRKKIAKSAKALACDFCRGLVFVGFVGSALVALMVPWGDRTANQMDEKLANIIAAVEGINRRLGDLEDRTGFAGDSGPVSFAAVIKKTISEVKDLRSRTQE